MEKSRVATLTPTALAFIGDAVQALYIRKRLVENSDYACGTLQAACSKFVNARAQAEAFDKLVERGILTDEESEIARRARNAHLHSHTKAASIADYHRATALEAIIGWLDVTDNAARRDEILELCFSITESSLTARGGWIITNNT